MSREVYRSIEDAELPQHGGRGERSTLPAPSLKMIPSTSVRPVLRC